MTVFVVLFWLSLFIVFYTYAGYPLLLLICRRYQLLNCDTRPHQFSVSVVIAARNEESAIVRRIADILDQNYPDNLLEIIVVSDGSLDRTETLVENFSARSVHLVRIEQSVGKAAALNYAVEQAQGDVLLFTDARQRFAPGAISALLRNFYDDSVGCVSGELIFTVDNVSDIQVEMGSYWRYEKWIRRLESTTGSVVGATGAIYAMRKYLYRPLPSGTILDDVLTPLKVVQQGYRCIFEGCAVAYDSVSRDVKQEWCRKVRTLAGNWQLLSLYPGILSWTRNPVWWRFISHKFLRLVVPFVLIIFFVSSMILAGAFYHFCAIIQSFFYTVAGIGLIIPSVRKYRLVGLSYFFCVMNAAAVCGFWVWVTGRAANAWRPVS